MLRRNFLATTGSAIGGSWIKLSLPAMMAAASTASKAAEAKKAFRALGTGEAAEYEAIAARIIPSGDSPGDSPGASEAGVIYFIDTVLADLDPNIHAPLKQGLSEFQASLKSSYGASSFAGLNQQQQIEALGTIEETDFFGTLRFLTVAGMFSDPSHGGNQNRVGWKLIGFDGPHGSQPPFGYYDADYIQKGE
jgi:gluconate 2-dehydrogenase gamma chain